MLPVKSPLNILLLRYIKIVGNDGRQLARDCGGYMSLEEEMRHEIRKIEKEIELLDEELTKLHGRILQILAIRKKKEHDIRTLRANFETIDDEREFQTSLAKLLKEKTQ
jgi:septal ring factor EnvC (AmiA/AmiB activator)